MKYRLRYIRMRIFARVFKSTIKRLEENILWNLNNGFAEPEGADFSDGMNFISVMILDRCVNQDERGVWSFCDA